MGAMQGNSASDFTFNLHLEKHFYTIGEVSELLHVTPAMLRNWERRFPQLRPSRTSGNHRQYTQEQVQTAAQIQHLLKTEGLTIDGAKARLRPVNRQNMKPIELIHRLMKVDQLLGQLVKQMD